jgi:ABC-2 type transport system permease protein
VSALTPTPAVANAQVHAVATIAYRDFVKFLRDPVRMVSTFAFPLIFVVVLGGSLQDNLGETAGYDFLVFTFTGVLAQTLFQSSALGIISMIEDRENDFSQEIFVAPISRYAIVVGKIAGESAVSLAQGLGLVALAVPIGVELSPRQVLGLVPTSVAACLLGGAFGLLVLSRLSSQRAAQQLFPFVFLPQFFLAGVFNPIKELPWYLEVLSRVSPLRYAVDLLRGVFYAGTPERDLVALDPIALNLLIGGAMFAAFLVLGTALFVRGERNR